MHVDILSYWFTKVIKLDVCGSLVFSNPVTYSVYVYMISLSGLLQFSLIYYWLFQESKTMMIIEAMLRTQC